MIHLTSNLTLAELARYAAIDQDPRISNLGRALEQALLFVPDATTVEDLELARDNYLEEIGELKCQVQTQEEELGILTQERGELKDRIRALEYDLSSEMQAHTITMLKSQIMELNHSLRGSHNTVKDERQQRMLVEKELKELKRTYDELKEKHGVWEILAN